MLPVTTQQVVNSSDGTDRFDGSNLFIAEYRKLPYNKR